MDGIIDRARGFRNLGCYDILQTMSQPKKHPRLVERNRDGLTLNAVGRRRHRFKDAYVHLLDAPPLIVALVLCGAYLLINVVFALLYVLVPGSIDNVRFDSLARAWLDAFFFSVQTFATIGYGGMVPHGLYGNALVTLESMCGFVFHGVVTGVMFAKFSRPSSRVLFSHTAVIGTHDGRLCFMLRLANERDNRIINAQAELTLMRDEITAENTRMRRFYDLKLIRNRIPLLRLTWTLYHIIDQTSPLHGMSADDLRHVEAEIIVSLAGIDETFAQPVHARHSYIADEIACNMRFVDVLHRRSSDGVLEVRYDRFHDIAPESI